MLCRSFAEDSHLHTGHKSAKAEGRDDRERDKRYCSRLMTHYDSPQLTTTHHDTPRLTTTHRYSQLLTTTHHDSPRHTTTHHDSPLLTATHHYSPLLTTTHHSLSTTHYSPVLTDHSPLNTHHSPLTTYTYYLPLGPPFRESVRSCSSLPSPRSPLSGTLACRGTRAQN
jgi:hypothetical protein